MRLGLNLLNLETCASFSTLRQMSGSSKSLWVGGGGTRLQKPTDPLRAKLENQDPTLQRETDKEEGRQGLSRRNTKRVQSEKSDKTNRRRTSNVQILTKDVIMLNPKDAKAKDLSSGDRATLKSDRGEITLDVEVTDRVKKGVVRTTFHFPEVLINEVTSGVTDEETKCPEYKIVAVDVLKAS